MGPKRTRYLIDKQAQYSYGSIFVLFFLASVIGVILPILIGRMGGQEFLCSLGSNEAFPTTTFIILLLACGIPGAVLAFLLGIVISHRTFGPTVRINDFLEKLIAGDYSARVNFREGDHLKDLLSPMNKLAETLQNRHSSGDKPR